ncbi:transcriptional regulator [Planococcus maritimus]|uniref:XRE family transcriptional regulator n=1 Tax=Planococcus rifietoensis TaxID=200991 RepID=A0A0U2XPI7_9BACL|nr:XRE family transcriptional regulator [Planococcus rifietoensis]ANU16762.1 transcriptional regulator [Planococcus maritimus]AUD13528.1 XRE family transcriptional regulator [Planococcus sp. MB-3u-03]PKG46045.1 XRE family transcriptional regulator [Planococcus sp. Urea-trap-24]PKG89966.1 XRE family transcriptional regulator [Planococcus sp. Urea-3u-39]PKH40587.1 XRE family transcriptional regulator [Planococcus sp. MB-3u-09]
MTLKKDLHTQLKMLREERNLSLDDLSLKTRIGTARLESYESGEEVPSVQTILVLSNALEVPASNLLDGLETTK